MTTPKEDLKAALVAVRTIADLFYVQAVRIPEQLHTFVEFTGLMREYANMVETTAVLKTDEWLMCNWGSIEGAQDFQVEYFAEKLECIFGRLFAERPDLQAVFLKKMGITHE